MLIFSQGLLWTIVLLELLAIIVLARQVGVLHTRISPVGALSIGRGPQPGEAVSPIIAETLSGLPIQIGGASAKARLLFFVAPSCPVCKTLLPFVKSVAKAEPIDLLVVGDDESSALADMATRFGLPADMVINNAEIGRAFQVGKLPYGVMLSPDGTLAAHGLINSREHLESLIAAYEGKVSSIQQFLRERHKAEPTKIPSN